MESELNSKINKEKQSFSKTSALKKSTSSLKRVHTMTVRKKMLLGFLAVGLLVVLAVGVVYTGFRKINNAVGIVKQEEAINENILEIRKQEKNYLLWHDDVYLENISESIKELKEQITLIKEQARHKDLIYALERIENSLNTYESLFNKVVENRKFHAQAVEEVIFDGKTLEEVVSKKAEADKITIWILQAYREEKNYSMYHDIGVVAEEKSYQDKFADAMENIKIASGNDPQIAELVDQYNAAFLTLAGNHQKGDVLIAQLIKQAVSTEEMIREIVEEAWVATDEVQRDAILIMWVVLISTVASVLFLSFFLSNKITRPINLLTFAANKISNDEIAQDIKVKSNDEIGILATAFNKMAVNLKEREKKLKHITFHDSLTGIYNRAYYDEEMGRLNKDLHRFKPLSILSIDIDGLKMVNDTLGHDKGDSYLKTVANIIKAPFRTTDIVARTGGDEFCIALPNTSGKVAGARRDEIEKLIDKYNAKKPIISLSLSIGIATTKDIKDETIYNISQESDDDMYRYKLIHNVSSRSKVIDILSMALAERDFIAKGHAERLSDMSVLIADNINLPDGKKRDLLLLSTVHDIGKIGISDKILFKPGKLTKKEFEKIKDHSKIGYKIANRSSELSHIAELILHHHEWWDGSGYPDGLKGKNIPIECRIISIADAYDAMTNNRPYHKAINKDEAIKELERFSGTQFDPILVKKAIQILREKGI